MRWYDWLNPVTWLFVAAEAYERFVEWMGKTK